MRFLFGCATTGCAALLIAAVLSRRRRRKIGSEAADRVPPVEIVPRARKFSKEAVTPQSPRSPPPLKVQPSMVSVPQPTTTAALFAWLGMSPAAGMPAFKAMHKHFPGALPSIAILHRTSDILHRHLGFEPGNTIYADSVCPDEINHEVSALPSIMAKHWGRGTYGSFPMGGLAGVPFVGKTGFSAFSHHVPTDGNVLILFGPHVGISADGVLGKQLRVGQKSESAACGAVLAAFNKCRQADKCGACLTDDHDLQQSWITQRISSFADAVATSAEPLEALVHRMYDEIEKELLQIVTTDFGSGNISLIGGVQINLPYPYECHFQPLFFKAWSAASPKPVDLLPKLSYMPPRKA